MVAQELEKDVVLCLTCVSQERKRQLNTIIKKPGSLSFYWIFRLQEALEKFRKHENSDSHLEAASMSVIGETHEDVPEMLCDTLSQEKFENRLIHLRIFKNALF